MQPGCTICAGCETGALTCLQVRAAQIKKGDREVYVNEQGERMSRLKEVNSDWILRRLERWGQRVSLLLLQQHGLEHYFFPSFQLFPQLSIPHRIQISALMDWCFSYGPAIRLW